MRQLTCAGPGVVEWWEVEAPTLEGPGEALVRPVAVARCELDPLLVLSGPLAGSEGFALGHEAVVEVVAVADDVRGVEAGDLALCSFQVSCGVCGRCRAGASAVCERVPVLADFGMQPLSGDERGGMLSDLVRVPFAEAMLVKVPAGVDPVGLASVPDNVVDGYRSVAGSLADRPGADVLVVVHGNRSIGLYAAQSALALGASSVTVTSDDPVVLEMAEQLGATARTTGFGRRSGRWPVVVDCGTRPAGLLHAVDSTESAGILHSVSYYLEDVVLPLGKMYTRGITFEIGRAHSAALLPEVVALVADGRLDPSMVTTQIVSWDEAAEHYLDDTVKLVVGR
jgi:alcohol dehydrogenase